MEQNVSRRGFIGAAIGTCSTSRTCSTPGDGRGLDKHCFVEHDSRWLSHPDDDQAEFKTALAGIRYLQNVRW